MYGLSLFLVERLVRVLPRKFVPIVGGDAMIIGAILVAIGLILVVTDANNKTSD